MGQKISKKRVFRGFPTLLQENAWQTCCFARLSSILQGIHLFDCKRCANNIIDLFSWKKLGSGPKSFEKNGFFGVFRHYFRKTFGKLAVLLRLSSNSQGSRLFNCRRYANFKIDHFTWKKIRFWAKKRRKNGFFGVFRTYFRKTLRKLAVSIQLSSNLQGSRFLKCKRCANNKREHFSRKKIEFVPKNFEKMGFPGFSTLLQENAAQTCCIAPIVLKFTGCPPILMYKVRK